MTLRAAKFSLTAATTSYSTTTSTTKWLIVLHDCDSLNFKMISNSVIVEDKGEESSSLNQSNTVYSCIIYTINSIIAIIFKEITS